MLGGRLDEASRTGVSGWARDTDYPDLPVSLLITIDDRLVERVIANSHRPDVEQAGFGHGRHGFRVTFNPPLLPARSWLIRVCAEADGRDLEGSPMRLPASDEFDAAAKAAVTAMLGSAATLAELDDRIGFLMNERERLLQMRAALQVRGTGRTARTTTPLRRALVLDDHGVPQPGHDGGGTALLSHIGSLQRLGYEVTFAAPQMADSHAASGLRQAGVTVCHTPWFNTVEEVLRRGRDSYDLVYLHRVATAASYLGLVRHYQPAARLVYSVADLHHVRLARQAAVEQQPGLMADARRLRTQELWAVQAADAVITHSPVEAALLRQALPVARVHVVAWAVPSRKPASVSRRSGMAFIGNFQHAPNLAAARLLRDAIMPAIQAADPGIRCQLVGADLPANWRAGQGGVDAVGAVADLSAVFRAVRLTIAPLRYGAGLKAKVMESLAAGVPCVCSPIAAEGLNFAEAGLGDLVVTDTVAAVAAVLRLHRDAAYNRLMSKLGQALARSAFSQQQLDSAMREVVGRAPNQAEQSLAPARPRLRRPSGK